MSLCDFMLCVMVEVQAGESQGLALRARLAAENTRAWLVLAGSFQTLMAALLSLRLVFLLQNRMGLLDF